MHNFEPCVVGLICILRLICWVVSCGISSYSSSLVPLSLSPFLSISLCFSTCSSLVIQRLLSFLPFFITCTLCFSQFFTRRSISSNFSTNVNFFVFLVKYYLRTAFVLFLKFSLFLFGVFKIRIKFLSDIKCVLLYLIFIQH